MNNDECTEGANVFNTANDEEVVYEDALELVGMGRFQWLMLLVCGLGNAADAVEILSVGLIMPSAGQDLEMSTSDKGLLSSCMFLGMIAGELIWGVLGDIIGRQKALVTTMGISGVFALSSCAVADSQTLVVLRTLAGVGVGGSIPVVFALYAEFLPTARRGYYMVLLASFWMMGSIYSAATGWLVIPVFGWRVFAAVAALPSLICCGLAVLLVPESPRYLLVQDKEDEALRVLRQAAKANQRQVPASLRIVKPGGMSHGHGPDGTSSPFSRIAQLWRNPHAGQTTALSFVWFGLSFGWFGTILWVPEYFKAQSSHNTASSDSSKGLSGAEYASTLAVALANLPGNWVSALLVERVGRKKTLVFCMAASSFFLLAFLVVPNGHPVVGTVVACGFNAISVGGWNTLPLYSAEIYPTAVRTSAMGVLGAMGRLGSACGGYVHGVLYDTNSKVFLAISIGTMWLGCLAALLALPVETAGMALSDTINDMSKQKSWGELPQGESNGCLQPKTCSGFAQKKDTQGVRNDYECSISFEEQTSECPRTLLLQGDQHRS